MSSSNFNILSSLIHPHALITLNHFFNHLTNCTIVCHGCEKCNLAIFPAVNGTTGEGMSLTVEERKMLAREWVEKSRGKWVVIHFNIRWASCRRRLRLVLFIYLFLCLWVHVCACLCRMNEVIVHVGCLSLKDSQELVSCWWPALQL